MRSRSINRERITNYLIFDFWFQIFGFLFQLLHCCRNVLSSSVKSRHYFQNRFPPKTARDGLDADLRQIAVIFQMMQQTVR